MCKYKEDIDKMCWSYSRLTSFKHCKYEFYLNYIINDDEEYLSESNFYAEVGSYVHEILAMIFNGELTIDKAAQYYVDNFDNRVFHQAKESTMSKTFETCADYFATVDFGWLNDYEILGVEKEIKFRLNGYNFIGYIDLLLKDKRDGKIVIVDHKSSEYPFRLDGKIKTKSISNFETYKKQMYLYAYAVSNVLCKYVQSEIDDLLYEAKYAHGKIRKGAQKALHKINYTTKAYATQKFEMPKEFIWNHFKDGGRLVSIPFNVDEYKKTIDWILNTINDIKTESDYSPSTDFFYCNNLCNFRNSCEYVQTTT